MKKTIFSLISFFALTTLISPVYAGGSNVMLDALNTGTINDKGKGVEVTVTIFDPYKNKLDWPELLKYKVTPKEYDPIGVAGLELELEFQDEQDGQYCEMKTTTTDKYGQVRGICYSDISGQFVVQTNFKTDAPLYPGGPSAKGAVFTHAITFYDLPNTTISIKPTTPTPVTPKVDEKVLQDIPVETEKKEEDPSKLTALEKQAEEQAKQIEELSKKLAEQEKEVSALKKIVNRIQEFFGGLFK